MRFCVFGAGRMGEQHIANVAAHEGAVRSRDRLLPGFMERHLPTYATELNYFVDAVSKGWKIDSDFQSARNAALLADAARKSMKEATLVRGDLNI